MRIKRTTAIIVSGGSGSRFSLSRKKQFQKIKNKYLLAHSIYPFQKSPIIDEIILVVPAEDLIFAKRAIVDRSRYTKVTAIVSGGEQRQDSVREGLRCVDKSPDFIFVHDGVRPFVKISEIEKAFGLVRKKGAVIFATGAKNTVKRVSGNGKILKTYPRDEIWEAHTPQIFRYDWLIEAYENAYRKQYYATDDSALVEKIGKPVTVFPCSNMNMKITYPSDLDLAKKIFETWRY